MNEGAYRPLYIGRSAGHTVHLRKHCCELIPHAGIADAGEVDLDVQSCG